MGIPLIRSTLGSTSKSENLCEPPSARAKLVLTRAEVHMVWPCGCFANALVSLIFNAHMRKPMYNCNPSFSRLRLAFEAAQERV